jgi:hypothetical protein
MDQFNNHSGLKNLQITINSNYFIINRYLIYLISYSIDGANDKSQGKQLPSWLRDELEKLKQKKLETKPSPAALPTSSSTDTASHKPLTVRYIQIFQNRIFLF